MKQQMGWGDGIVVMQKTQCMRFQGPAFNSQHCHKPELSTVLNSVPFSNHLSF